MKRGIQKQRRQRIWRSICWTKKRRRSKAAKLRKTARRRRSVQLGSTIRFTLNFSEYIRFADDSASHEPGLEFEILPYGEIVSDPIRLKADFVELYDNKMVFEYTFLDEYSGYEGIKEFYISRIEKITQQEDFDAKYDLALLPKEIADAAKTPTVTVNNLITDLAGNAVEEVLATDESGAVTGEREIVFNSVKIDSKAPSVQNVGIEKKLTVEYYGRGRRPVRQSGRQSAAERFL